MVEQKLYELKDAKTNETILWNKQLKPRERSGIVGEITINAQFTIAEAKHLMKALNFEATNKYDFECGILKSAGYQRIAKKPETETNPARTDTTNDLTEKEQRFINEYNEYYEKLKKSGKPLPNAEKTIKVIDNNFSDKSSRERLYNYYKVKPETDFKFE